MTIVKFKSPESAVGAMESLAFGSAIIIPGLVLFAELSPYLGMLFMLSSILILLLLGTLYNSSVVISLAQHSPEVGLPEGVKVVQLDGNGKSPEEFNEEMQRAFEQIQEEINTKLREDSKDD